MCSHQGASLEDYHTADVICLDCGVITDRIIGGVSGGGGGGRVTTRGRRWLGTYGKYRRASAIEERPEEIRQVLISCGMDSEELYLNVMLLYDKLFANRPNTMQSEAKSRIAAAFSVVNVLARESAPRPPEVIARAFGLNSCRPLLDIVKSLGLKDRELCGLKRVEYTMPNQAPQDYIDVVCAQLGIPIGIANAAVDASERLQWIYHDRPPTNICAAVLQAVLQLEREEESAEGRRKKRYPNYHTSMAEDLEAAICELLGTHEKTTAKLADVLKPKIRSFLPPRV